MTSLQTAHHTRPTVLRAAPSDSTNVSSTPTVLRGGVLRNTSPSHDQPSTGQPGVGQLAPSATRSVAQPSPETVLRLDPALHEYVQTLMSAAADEAYASGVSDGRSSAMQTIDTLARSIEASVEQVRSLTVDHRGAFTNEVCSLAESIATAVLERTPHDGGKAVLDAVQGELSNLADTTVTLSVHVDDMATIAAGINRDDVEIAVDPKLLPGEVLISTQWSTIERTRSATWSAIRGVLENDDV